MYSPAIIGIGKGSTFAGKSPYLGVPLLMIGCVMTVAGMIDDLILIPIGLALAAAGLVVFMKIKGVTIDPQEGRLRIYENYLLFRLGRWMDPSTYDRILVKRYRE
jgi:hypothetical protein